ncbi:hypothetical protein LOK49_LG02G01081 [Camellia lanceoleosa]|uniref:Uncharacterized protein n=1 Tax=Camellia lanceoleosa TaxID=1840588 RepID=A0ACC0ITD1_9ERIC|nr:hypothetical protein LOK49_LG02G01081 [Camellia lanceoleosa]
MDENGRDRKVVPAELHKEATKAYMAYAMSVLLGRALPDIRDGLKPDHRRILFAMHELGLSSRKPGKNIPFSPSPEHVASVSWAVVVFYGWWATTHVVDSCGGSATGRGTQDLLHEERKPLLYGFPSEQWEVNLLLKRCLQSSQSCIKHLLCRGWDAREGLVGSSSQLSMHGYFTWPSILVLDLVLIKRTEEKVLAIRKGDAIALPFGVVTWWYNKEDTELVVLFLGDTSKGHKAGSFTDFFLTGSNGIFNGFSTEFVSRAWDLEENVVKTMVGKQTGNVNCDLQQKPSFELSGKLATETNSVRGTKWLLVVLAAASEDGDDDDNSVTET